MKAIFNYEQLNEQLEKLSAAVDAQPNKTNELREAYNSLILFLARGAL